MGVMSILRLIETFSGIGAQAQALTNIGADFKTVATVEWEIGAMYAYDILHNGKQDLTPYRHHTKSSLVECLSQYNLSNDGKTPLTVNSLNSMSTYHLKQILAAIDNTNNLVDITNVSANDLPDGDILTYSFPCQDLSVGGNWHHNSGGIDRNAKNRSTLLWQIERILKEYQQIDKNLPRYLLMENVSAILSDKHIGNFMEWCTFLEDLGYVNKVLTLDARNFGIPQFRVRTYMLSVKAEDKQERSLIENYLRDNDLENTKEFAIEMEPLDKYLRLDYDNPTYKTEALLSTPHYTPSREKIFKSNPHLAVDRNVFEGEYARTITTKQDRNPNSGIVTFNKEILTDKNRYYRNLTPRECFLLMGVKEEDYDKLMDNNYYISKDKRILPDSKLIKLAGNSIAIPVLEAIFKQIEELDAILNHSFSEIYS